MWKKYSKKLHIYVEKICTHVKRELYSFKCEESEAK
jgi:hypothetical protein